MCPVTNELEDICLKATNALNGQIVGVDLMESNSEGLVYMKLTILLNLKIPSGLLG